ncbi:MAG: AGE family epimerase/isomerase [Spirochaetales bacterium]
MTKSDFKNLHTKYHDALFNDVIPFWLNHSLDKENGGYFSCLDRDGTVFDTDKFMWLQGRGIWMFSKLCSVYGIKNEWLEAASCGAEFVRTKGLCADGSFYFSLNKEGKPLVQPYNIFSDCFICVGLCEYFKVTQQEWARDLALQTYAVIQNRKNNPKGQWLKQIPETRTFSAMAFPMIQLWMAREMRDFLPKEEVDKIIKENTNIILTWHVDYDLQCVFERVGSDGSHNFDVMEGRLLNPGHALEVLWFIMLLANDEKNTEMVDKIADIMLWCIERGWDKEYGGIFYYQDYKNFPPEKLESDMKLWWVHNEALAAFLLAFKLTGKKEHKDWFLRIDSYVWEHFPDPRHGEWFGYLSRDGKPIHGLKGGKWKGFFHLPRMLMFCEQWLSELSLRNL